MQGHVIHTVSRAPGMWSARLVALVDAGKEQCTYRVELEADRHQRQHLRNKEAER